MAEAHKAAEQDYMNGMKYKDIADKYGVTLNTVKSWKQRHGWERGKGAPSEKGVHTKRKGAPDGNRYAVGNSGGAAPRGNSNAVTHGLFRKFLPNDAETLEIFDAADSISPLDMLWTSIRIKWTNIVRAQKIMFVRDKDDMTKVLKRTKESDNMSETEWELQHAWDKQATALNAQARAMGQLASMIRQYEDMIREASPDEMQDKRRLELQKMKLEIDKLDPKADQDKEFTISVDYGDGADGDSQSTI